jgi:predicted small metal-binding protein
LKDTTARELAIETLEKVDQFLCEHVIDDCGYDVEAETVEELKHRIIVTSEECEEMLDYVREQLSKLKQQL